LGVDQSIVDALSGKGITSPFPIQDMAIPLALTGTDLIAQARTGTGETLAFGVPLMQRIVTRADSDYDELEAPETAATPGGYGRRAFEAWRTARSFWERWLRDRRRRCRRGFPRGPAGVAVAARARLG